MGSSKTVPRRQRVSRRRFIASVVAASAVSYGPVADRSRVRAQKQGSIRGFDHVALPMRNTDAMLAFYRGLGLPINEGAQA